MKNHLTSILFVLFISIGFLSKLQAQCQASTAQIDLEGDNVTTRLHAGGDLWWDGVEGKYLYPKPPQGIPELGVSAMKAGGIWMGGLDSGLDLRVAAQTDGRSQGRNDYWPGPGDNATDCLNFDRHWTMKKDVIDAHIADYQDNGVIDGPIHGSILAWPGDGNPNSLMMNGFEIPVEFGRNYAPFEDVNFDGIYNPQDGDYPAINCASNATWWMFNDFAGMHTQSAGVPLNFRSTMLAYTYESSNENIQNTTFYEMRVRNKGIETINLAYIGLWIDFDLGCPFDDLVGIDTLNNLAYAYNVDQVDGISNCNDCAAFNTYCEEPPMVGIQLLNGPPGPKVFVNGIDGSDGLANPLIGQVPDTIVELGISSFIYYNAGANDPFPNVPSPSVGVAQEYYNMMKGLWPDGTQITRGGSGYDPSSTDYTNYVFPSRPDDDNGWSMCSENFEGGNRKTVLGFGPLSLEPDAITRISFAVVATKDITYPCPSLDPLIQAGQDALEYTAQGNPSNPDGCSFFVTSTESPNQSNDRTRCTGF